ncbi:hypothetical protein PYCCODRAFT_1449760 [Trametes coccinea BRFM310]|uniref:Fungal-type protein kinase domain-containing protein n=1 Tax=Trametes coccinea (strain BRFM310) TaxID=1353009 RepID=A0A1Y2J0Z6_TRAC3|nr:hypothetical protein PYCCODRAFT_1449760 [Trametes coccinea BRFM310]
MALDLDLTQTSGLKPLLALARNNAYIQDARRFTIGPMSVAPFMETFLPLASDDTGGFLSAERDFDDIPVRADNAAEIFEPLVSALDKKTETESRCPGFAFEKTYEHSLRPARLGYAKPHICCFAPENLAHVRSAHRGSRAEFGYAELFIQTTPDPEIDFFVDPEPDADEGTLAEHEFIQKRYKAIDRAFGLHMSFVAEIFARQHRRCLFTVSLAGSHARLYRWDRSGCVVTRAFDVREDSVTFAEFFWRFSKLSDGDRGHDLTVRLASAEEESLFRETVRAHVALQLGVAGEELDKAILAHYKPGHVTAIRVDSQPPQQTGNDTFIVSRPVASALSVDGPGTRGYWAVSAATGRIAFLKDTWRRCSRRSPSEVEGDVLLHLNELGVCNIPQFTAHGDVMDHLSTEPPYQDTLTGQLSAEPWKCRIDNKEVYVSRRRHYRLVTQTVGYSLKTIRGTEELLHSTYDVFQAMRYALAKASRSHRDLSAGNIILVKEHDRSVRKGYLIDWEASDRVDDKGESIHTGRNGTWAFNSMRLLGDRKHEELKHTFQDDMESLLYVVFYCALLYLPHDLSDEWLTWTHDRFFYDTEMMGKSLCGGKGKLANAWYREYTFRLHFESAAFQEWFDTMLDYHHPRKVGDPKLTDRWKPEVVDAFWSHFLETHDLERDNRTVHHLIKFEQYDPDSPESEPRPSPSPPRPSKRSVDIGDPDAVHDERPRKSRRRNNVVAATSSSAPHHSPTTAHHTTSPDSHVPLRRSQRIRARAGKSGPIPQSAEGSQPSKPKSNARRTRSVQTRATKRSRK